MGYQILALTLGSASAQLLGGKSESKACDNECRSVLNEMVEHHNAYQTASEFKQCTNVKVTKWPAAYRTQVVAGQKYIFEDLEISEELCGTAKLATLEGVIQPWIMVPQNRWNYFHAEEIFE